MTTTDLTSIPLPVEPSVAVTARKTARDMLQEALKEHKTSSSGKESNSSSKHTSVKPGNALAPKNSITGNAAAGETSQSIVDELFKDFIAQKLKSVSRRTSDETAFSGRRSSADAINEILDMEIQSIKTHTENKDGLKSQEKLVHKKHHSSEAIPKQPGLNYSSISLGQKINSSFQKETEPPETFNNHSTVSRESSLSAETKKNSVNEVIPQASSGQISSAADGENNSSAPENVGPVNDNTVAALSPAVQQKEKEPPQFQNNVNNTIIKKNVMLPTQLARKLMPPKLLGVKLSTESLSLIQSTDRIDRNGRVWEEGEVQSSNSEESEKEIVKSDSEPDDLPSDSGSIHSNSEDSKISSSKHKKKHRHKHKRKRKKSTKEKDKESNERESKDRSRDKNKGKDKDGITKDKDKHKSHSKSDGGSDRRSSKDRDESLRSGSKEGEKCEAGQSEQVKEKSSDREHEGMKKKDRKRKRSHSRSRSPQRQKRSRSRSHSRSRSPKRHGRRSSSGSYYSEWDARRYSDDPSKFSSKDHSRSRSRSKEKHRRSRDRSRSRERSQSKERKTRDLRLQIDKAKLRKIAITNALQNMRMGQGPQVDLTVLKSGGKSVEELTEFCKKISEKGKAGAKSDSGSDEDTTKNSDDEDMLIHHPFKVKEASTSSIVMNIRNAKQLPVLTPSEKQVQQAALRLTFPVSSGSHHRANESEWVPVVKTPPAAAAAAAAPAVSSPMPTSSQVILETPAVEEQRKPDSIFPDPAEAQKIDISSVISERLQAVRKLQENPYDIQALNKMHQIQEQASMWATSKHLPGQFVGSTGAHVLSQEELIGDKRHQAWAKKAQMTQAAPVNGGIGMFLLQKMGWKQGEGLGKNNEGSKVPLLLDVKVDRRGLTTAAENPRSKTQVVAGPRPKDLSNKHPVSALMELCNRRRWGPPLFTVVQESGPDHKKCFLFKVRVNNIEYQPAIPSSNKKMAKAQCAAVCLQEMGLIPRDAPLNI